MGTRAVSPLDARLLPAAALAVGARRAIGPRRAIALLVAVGIVLGVTLAPPAAHAHAPALETSVTQNAQAVPGGHLTFGHVRAAGASYAQLSISWKDIAPAQPLAGFIASNPDDRSYDWREFDQQVTLAAASGIQPIINIGSPPAWAVIPGTGTPDPVQLSLFSHAAAERYSGTRPGLPRVRYWTVWNEPNMSAFMAPQQANGQPIAVERYRDMINDVAAQVHSVRADNMVVAGQLFPNFVSRPDLQATAPLAFTRALFCLSADPVPRPTCHTQVHADIWSIHPYTSGQPSDTPPNPDSVWIGNLSNMRTLLDAAQRVGNLVSSGPAAFWVTEFGWNTNPPRADGVPVMLAARWMSEALYRMWAAGVSLASYFLVRDDSSQGSIFQSGLYYSCAGGLACDRPKPALMAFKFPFVAFTTGRRRVLVWGRTPFGAARKVVVQFSTAQGWRRLATLGTDGDGIFTTRVRVPGGQRLSALSLRAVLLLGGSASVPFTLRRPPDVFVTPFA